jgi:hypothetical protein
MYPTESVVDNVSDLSVTVAGCYEDPTVADALREMYECEAEITEADVEDMHRAAEKPPPPTGWTPPRSTTSPPPATPPSSA